MATKETSKERVAANIKAERVRAGLTQEELANMSGVKLSAIRTYEQAQVSIPLGAAARIASSLGVSLDEIAYA